MVDYAIHCLNLGKTYDSKIEALKNLAVSIWKGELFTLLGPNGAGKTTLLRIISTILTPSYGEAYVQGHSIVDEVKKVRELIAVVPQDVGTHTSVTPWDYSYYYARLRGMSGSEAKAAASKALQEVQMWELRNRICASLSGGEKRRAIIAAILASDADVLLLDEPTAGLDAIARRQVWSSLRNLRERGKTVLLTTHNMEEAEMISDRIGILNKGVLVAAGTVSEIRDRIEERYRVVVDDKFNGPLEVETLNVGDRRITYFRDSDDALDLVSRLVKMGYKAEVAPVTLEDVFVRILGRAVN